MIRRKFQAIDRVNQLIGKKQTGKRRRQQAQDDECIRDVHVVANKVLKSILHKSDHLDANNEKTTTDDYQIEKSSVMCDSLPLKMYENRLQHVPAIVNVVARATTSPVPGTGTLLPLNLENIAARCSGAYWDPQTFCPVQLYIGSGRKTRVLIFATGNILTRGSDGPMDARTAVVRTLKILGDSANVWLSVDSFKIDNLVGAVRLNANINCELFSKDYPMSSHYDKSSFGAMQYKPSIDGICCEVFPNGKVNIPNAKTYLQLLEEFSNTEPKLMEYSSKMLQNVSHKYSM